MEEHKPWRQSEKALLMAIIGVFTMAFGVCVNSWISIFGMLMFMVSAFAALTLADSGR